MIVTEGYGNIALDISSYQGEIVDMAWVLYWGGPYETGETIATVSNIQLSSDDTHPVPEPSTIVLFGAGICGLSFLRRKKS